MWWSFSDTIYCGLFSELSMVVTLATFMSQLLEMKTDFYLVLKIQLILHPVPYWKLCGYVHMPYVLCSVLLLGHVLLLLLVEHLLSPLHLLPTELRY